MIQAGRGVCLTTGVAEARNDKDRPGVSPTAQLELEMRFEGGIQPDVASLIAGYRPEPGIYDELVDATGHIRPHWGRMLGLLCADGPEQIRRAFAAADRHMRDAGVVYRVYDDPGGVDRPWPLSHLPLVIAQDAWEDLATGIVQRARLHEALLADLHGPQTTITSGTLPAALVAGNSEYLRPLQRVEPAGGHFLHLYAADVSRGPDGRWWVLSDRTQAPSGLGYAIENRIALSRALPDMFRALNVDRLAGFYQQFRAALSAKTGRSDPRIAVLTPGPANETYFEHAYLARCLGFLLVEGGDLTVHQDIVYVRTIDGPKRIDAIVRRIDADFADPLELNAASRLGVPGLVEAVRAGTVVLANALGSGLTEAPALNGYFPALARTLLGETLSLPSLATWWCGDPVARREVLATLETKAILPAFGRTLKGRMDNAGVLGSSLGERGREAIAEMLARRGLDFIGQEPVRLATVPVWEKGRLAPHPYAIRIFACRGPQGWTVMPGGLCRISDRPDARALSMQRGGRSADVWVLCDKAPDMSMLVPRPEDVEVSRQTGALPSRAADNLFWFGRYLERADATLRLVRNLLGRGTDNGPFDDEDAPADRLAAILAAWGAVEFAVDQPLIAADQALNSTLVGAMPALIGNAYRTATAIRDRLSPDAWRALTDLHETYKARPDAEPASPSRNNTAEDSQNAEPDADDRSDARGRADDLATRAHAGLRTISALAGLAHENMNRLGGWRFLDLGVRVERAISIARFARRLTEDERVDVPGLDCLLDLADAQVAYRARYFTGSARRPVIDLVLLDISHPRSVAFQVEAIIAHLKWLEKAASERPPGPADEAAAALWDRLQGQTVEKLTETSILEIEGSLMAISDAITRQYLAGQAPTSESA